MIVESTDNLYKIATQTEEPWVMYPVTIFKRVSSFNWQFVDVYFDSIEDAKEYIKYADIIEE